MIIQRFILHCLLAFVVVIATSNAVLARASDNAAHTQALDTPLDHSRTPPCHADDAIPQPETPNQAPCCSDGLCGCGCVPALAVVLASQQAPDRAIRPVAVLGYTPRVLLAASRQPALRPPIG